MKLPYITADKDGNELYRCAKCGPLPQTAFYKSDISCRRTSCKKCRQEKAKAQRCDQTKVALSRFKVWAKRHNHPEVGDWETSDIESVVASVLGLGIVKDVILRPVDFSARQYVYCPHDVRAVSIENSWMRQVP